MSQLPVAPRRRSHPSLALRVAIGVFAVLALSPNTLVTDSIRVVPVAHNLLTRGTLTFDPLKSPFPHYYGVTLRGTHSYPLFPWTISLFLVPATGLMDLAHVVGIGPGAGSYGGGSPTDWPLELVTMSVVVAATAALTYLIGVEVAESGDHVAQRRLGLTAASILAFCTAAWSTASRAAWQHGPSMLFIAAALLVCVRARRRPLAAGCLGFTLAGAVVVRPTNVVPAVALAVWALVVHRKPALRAVPSALAVLGPFVAVNEFAYHAMVPPYFLGNSLGGQQHFFEALAGNLVSPARGLLIFSPIVILAPVGLWRRIRRRQVDGLDTAMVGTVLVHWIVISRLFHWWGGFQYGPRLFTDVVPFLVVLTLPALDAVVNTPRRTGRWFAAAAATVALAGWSFFANAEGALLRSSGCWNITPNIEGHPNRVWSWSDPQVLAGARGVLHRGLGSELTPGGYAASTLTLCPGAGP